MKRKLLPTLGSTAASAVIASAAALAAAGTSPSIALAAGHPATTGHKVAVRGQDPLTFSYTGHTQTVTVPDHVGYAELTVSGGQGSNQRSIKGSSRQGGYGAIITGKLPVKAGDVLTVAVGGWGGEADGKNIGGGGWSLPGYNGGDGGNRKGLIATAGSGGGGASVIEVDGTVAVVASGGGGQGGESASGGDWNAGGNAGTTQGENGDGETSAGSGKGGGSSNPHLDPNGEHYTGAGIVGGGGGGGGGYYRGGGGQAHNLGGGDGGGGGSSYYPSLTDVTTKTGVKCSGSKCTAAGNGNGHGSITLTWLAPSDTQQTYAFQKTGAPDAQLLEIPGGRRDNETPANTWRRTNTADGAIQNNQLWDYKLIGRLGTGQLVSKETGKCLELNGITAAVDQNDCVEQANELWKIVPGAGTTSALEIDIPDNFPLAPGTYYLATTVDSAQVHDGTPLTLSKTQGDRTTWDALLQK